MINKYWDLKNVSFDASVVQENDYIAYGATRPKLPPDTSIA